MSALTFSDVLIIPKYSEVESRKDVDISVEFATSITTLDLVHNSNIIKLKLPVISANMKTITGPKMAAEMALHGGLGILHRFTTIEKSIEEFDETKKLISNTITDGSENMLFGVSIGVQEEDKKRFIELTSIGAKIFCLDVAHGHTRRVKEMLKWIVDNSNKNSLIIAGNVATGDGAYDLVDWGADIVKVGIGPGSACSTRRATGVGVPQLHAIKEVREEFDRQGINKRIISDGGITAVGDICKALKYADAVMLGNFISGTSETPGHVFRDENQNFYKVYQGSASGENKNDSGYAAEYIEGISKKVQFRGHVKHILREIEQGIKSSCSYVGAFNLDQFKEKCDFIEISCGGKVESKL